MGLCNWIHPAQCSQTGKHGWKHTQQANPIYSGPTDWISYQMTTPESRRISSDWVMGEAALRTKGRIEETKGGLGEPWGLIYLKVCMTE